ncbi:MAG: ABC transporter permease [Phycisphaerae bacterium]|nr:ABC transporter permease [Phycisphaerae bacterium]
MAQARSNARLTREVIAGFVALLLVVVGGAVFNADGLFFRAQTHLDALGQNAAFGVLACGLTLVIITGGIDLAVGSIVALAGVVFAILALRHGMAAWIAWAAALGVGAAGGLTAGSLVAHARLQPFVATLAIMAFARGLAKWSTDGVKVQKFPYPPVLEALNSQIHVAGVDIPISIAFFVVTAGATLVVLRTTTLGVWLYSIGDNEQAARYAGVPVKRVKVIAYTLCGVLSGLAGVLFCGLERQGNPDAGVGYELTAIAMVVIGGTSLAGGRGGALLTVLGTLVIAYLRKVLDINGVGTAEQYMITGVIIVLAVLAQGLRRRG